MRQRIRSIKPEVFSDGKLWDVEVDYPHAFRIFSGLWTIADREGRFEWKPREIGALLMPYHQEPVRATLYALVDAGLVRCYVVNGEEFAALPGFRKHQVPNAREPASALPTPPWETEEALGSAPDTTAHVHARAEQERVPESDAPHTCASVSSGKGREGNGEGARVSDATALDPWPKSTRTLARGEVINGETLREFIRSGVAKGYESIKKPAPRETRDLLWDGWAELEHWTVEKSRLLGRPQRDTGKHLVRCFLRSSEAKRRGYPIGFLVQNANEYWRDELPAEVAA